MDEAAVSATLSVFWGLMVVGRLFADRIADCSGYSARVHRGRDGNACRADAYGKRRPFADLDRARGTSLDGSIRGFATVCERAHSRHALANDEPIDRIGRHRQRAAAAGGCRRAMRRRLAGIGSVLASDGVRSITHLGGAIYDKIAFLRFIKPSPRNPIGNLQRGGRRVAMRSIVSMR